MTAFAVEPAVADEPLPGANPVVAYRRFWVRYVVLTGRASRSEYWWTQAWHAAVYLLLLLFGAAVTLLGSLSEMLQPVAGALGALFWLLVVAYTLAIVVPQIALSVRRMHDADLSGLFLLLVLLIAIGEVIVLVLHLLPSSPNGRRFDAIPGIGRGPEALPSPASRQVPAPVVPSPADDVAHPATSPMPITTGELEVPGGDVWAPVGRSEAVEPPFTGPAAWQRIGYVRVALPDGRALLATRGLAVAEGAAALGPGAELWIAADTLPPATALPDSWWFAVLAGAARRIAASGAHLPAELEQYDVLSMAVPAPQAPAALRGPDGGVGVLLGIGLPGVPESAVTAAGELRLVGLTPLTPDELQQIVAGGRTARDEIAARIRAAPTDRLQDPALRP